jgi:hypothetical protein
MRCYPFLLMIMILLMIFQGIVANRKDQELIKSRMEIRGLRAARVLLSGF